MRTLKVAVVAGVVVSLGAAALLLVNPLARYYVQTRYPDVTRIDSLQVHWDRSVDCQGVVFERSGLKATFDHLHVDANKKITITGGTVDLALTSATSTPNAVPNEARDFRVKAYRLKATVRYEGLTFTSPQVDVTETCAHFAEGSVQHPRGSLALTNGNYDRPSKTLRVSQASIQVDPKAFGLPGKWSRLAEFTTPQPVVAHNLVANLSQLSAPQHTLVEIERVEVGESLSDPATRIGPMWSFNDLKVDSTPRGYEISAYSVQTNHSLLKTRWADAAGINTTSANLMYVKVLANSDWEKQGVSIQIGQDNSSAAPIAARIQEDHVDATASCRGWLASLPGPIVGDLTVVDDLLDSTSGDLTIIVKMRPQPQIKIQQNCAIKCSSSLISRLKAPFKQTVYKPNGSDRYLRHTGPGTEGWVPYGLLPPHVPDAFVTLEDPGFPHHKGVHLMALNNSLKQNVEANEIVRGGSTITMQLVRNLWLSRHQTLQRKGREVILAWMLESCLSKSEILELYLNVIEFGPDTYGISAGSEKWFGSGPGSLTLEEAFYLASILPSPNKATPPDQGGMDRVERLMASLAASGAMPEHLQMLMPLTDLP